MGVEKPDPRIFKEALNRMGCKPEDSVMVGDKFKEDIIGAVNAGMSAILVNSKLKDDEKDYIKREKLDIEIISNIGELKNIL